MSKTEIVRTIEATRNESSKVPTLEIGPVEEATTSSLQPMNSKEPTANTSYAPSNQELTRSSSILPTCSKEMTTSFKPQCNQATSATNHSISVNTKSPNLTTTTPPFSNTMEISDKTYDWEKELWNRFDEENLGDIIDVNRLPYCPINKINKRIRARKRNARRKMNLQSKELEIQKIEKELELARLRLAELQQEKGECLTENVDKVVDL